MQDHLDRDALERLVHRRCHASRAYGWLLHLLACIECRERVARDYPAKGERFLREIFRTQEPLRPPDLDDQNRLDRVLEDLQTRGLAEYLQEGDIPPLLADLHRHPPERQRLILDNTERLWNLGTVEYLFERCEREFHRDPRYGQHLAELALSVLDRLSSSHYHPRLLHDLRGRGWGLRGNFLRIRERIGAAKRDFRRANNSLESGTGDSDERSRLLNFCGLLAASQRRFRQSIALRESSLRMSRTSGNRKTELWAVAGLVARLPDAGRAREAIQLGEDTLARISVEQVEPNTLLSLKHNLALVLSDTGRSLPAYRLYQEVLRAIPTGQPRIRVKVEWQQLTIFENLGNFEAADSVAQFVTDRVVEQLGRQDYAVLLTDRARLALRKRDRGVARRYGREACWIFEQNGHPNLAREMQRMLEGGPLVYF